MTKFDKILITLLVVATLICVAKLIFNLDFTLFEDGSFNIGGCLPWAICHL